MIPYFIAVFIDWKVYDKNRNFRLIYSAKKSDPRKILQLKSDLSRLPFATDKSRNILRFSFVSKPFLRNIRSIKSDLTSEANIIDLNDTTIVAQKKSILITFSNDLLTESQSFNLRIVCDIIQAILSKKDLNYDYCVTKISHIHNDIYYINVDQCYCLIKNIINKSNRVYFVYNVGSSVLRFKCFDCGHHQFIDIHVPL